MAVELHDELIVEILSFLPAKSLLRCLLVCKLWLSLITSTKFKLMHLHNFNQLNPRYLVRRWYEDKELYSVHLDDRTLTIDHGTFVEFPFSISRVNNCFRIVGCCNGVVCLCDDKLATSSLDTIILWNPSIRRKLTLPFPTFCSVLYENSYVILGFGYDKMFDDYKVVKLTYFDDPKIRPHVEVYSVKSGIWREVMFPDHNLRCFFIFVDWSQMFFNGSMHWIANEPGVKHNSMMTFDISTEIFGEVQLPEFLASEYSDTLVVSAFGESLALIYSSNLNVFNMYESSGSTIMVWVMKEYNNPTSWTMIYNVQYPVIDTGKPLRLGNYGDMMLALNNGDIIIHNGNVGYYVYAFGVCSKSYFICRTYVDKYQESLALLDVGHSVPNEEALMMIEKQEKLMNDHK